MKKLIIIFITVFAAAFICGCVSSAQIQSYNAGVKAYEGKDFELAKAYFEAANGYGNSPSYLSAIAEYEKIYVEALEFFNARDYDRAINSFDAIRDFGNSAEYLAFMDRLKARYDEGVSAFEAQDFRLANMRFIQSLGWADSAAYLSRIQEYEDGYRVALAFLREGNYVQALNAFERIGVPYRDSEERIEAIFTVISTKGMTPTIFRESFNASCEEQGEEYSLPVSDPGETGFAWRTTNGLMIMGNTDSGFVTMFTFWMDSELMASLGGEGSNRLLAHCIRALAMDGESFESILSDIDLYFEGSRVRGAYSLLLEEDDSGAEVLTATRRPD